MPGETTQVFQILVCGNFLPGREPVERKEVGFEVRSSELAPLFVAVYLRATDLTSLSLCPLIFNTKR